MESVWHQFSLDHWHLSTASNWIGVQTGSIPVLHKNLKTFEANIWFSSYDHLTNVGGQKGGFKGACFLLNKKEALSGLIQVNDDEERKGWHKQGESMVASYRYLERYPIQAYKWLGAMSVMFPVCTAPGPRFQYIRRIPALYYSQA